MTEKILEDSKEKLSAFNKFTKEVEEAIEKEASAIGARWWLLTDGSGMEGKDAAVPGASAWVVWDAVNARYHVGVIGSTGSDVDKAELNAGLGGLEFISEEDPVRLNADGEVTEVKPIVWIGDRESMIRAAIWRPDGQGTLYKRRVNAHLWAQYAWFEKRYKILPVRRDRNTLGAQALCDALCGQLRLLIRDWYASEKTQQLIKKKLNIQESTQ